jgi:hypothetical protein
VNFGCIILNIINEIYLRENQILEQKTVRLLRFESRHTNEACTLFSVLIWLELFTQHNTTQQNKTKQNKTKQNKTSHAAPV